MPFKSKRQQRAMFGGHIPGMTKEDAKEWAHETPNIKKLPDRAPAEKGKPTLRSKKAGSENDRRHDALNERLKAQMKKKANGDMLQHFLDHPKEAENYLDRKERERTRRGKTASVILSEFADFTPALEDLLTDIFKTAALGSSVMKPSSVGKLKGMMTSHAMKAPGYAASSQAINPRRNIVAAMNANKPH
jgi:hypothetical protein